MIRGPGLVELVTAFQAARLLLLLSGRRPGLRIECKRHFVPHRINSGITSLRVFRVALGKQYGRIDVDRMAPECRQFFAANANVFHPFRIGRSFGGRDHMVDGYVELPARPEMNLLYAAIKISRRVVEELLFAIIQMNPNRVAIGTVNLGVNVDYGLSKIIPGRQIAERFWIAESCRIYGCRLTRLKMFDIHTKDSGAGRRYGKSWLRTRLRLRGPGSADR